MVRRTEKRLAAKQVTEKKEPGRYTDGGGLYLDIDGEGRKRWIWRYTRAGRTREMGLGSLTSVTLAEARAERDRWREVIRSGRDPIDERAAGAARTVTFGEIADEYIDAHRSSWRSARHLEQWEMTLREYAKPIRAKPIAEVSTLDILGVLKPLWDSRRETALRLRGRIELVIDAARAKGHIPESTANPARWRGHLDKLLPKRGHLERGHHAALPWPQAPAFLAALRAVESISARAIEFTVLTAARSGETRMAVPAEFDLDAAIWTVPAKRMKSGRAHRVPLSPRAIEIVRELRASFPTSVYVFPGGRPRRPLTDSALSIFLRRTMRPAKVTLHGFRSTFRDWAGEATSFPRDLAEAALAHVVGDQTEAAYRRGDALERRRGLMLAWETYLDGARGADVIPLRPRARKGP